MYVRSRGRLEVWRTRFGPRVAALAVPSRGRLVTHTTGHRARCFLMLRPEAPETGDSDEEGGRSVEGDGSRGNRGKNRRRGNSGKDASHASHASHASQGSVEDRCILQEIVVTDSALARVFAHFGKAVDQQDDLRIHRFVDGLRHLCRQVAKRRLQQPRKKNMGEVAERGAAEVLALLGEMEAPVSIARGLQLVDELQSMPEEGTPRRNA